MTCFRVLIGNSTASTHAHFQTDYAYAVVESRKSWKQFTILFRERAFSRIWKRPVAVIWRKEAQSFRVTPFPSVKLILSFIEWIELAKRGLHSMREHIERGQSNKKNDESLFHTAGFRDNNYYYFYFLSYSLFCPSRSSIVFSFYVHSKCVLPFVLFEFVVDASKAVLFPNERHLRLASSRNLFIIFSPVSIFQCLTFWIYIYIYLSEFRLTSRTLQTRRYDLKLCKNITTLLISI